MKIKVKLSKTTNYTFYHTHKNQIIEIDFDEYLCGVVAAEIGNAPIEACKAQAVASRTVAYPYALKAKVISDATPQCFNAERAKDYAYKNAQMAVTMTHGEMVYSNGEPVNPCSFSANNGGRTTSSKQRWGGYRSWLIEQDDPWDSQASYKKKTGHGVGMSQAGCKQAALLGFSYTQILEFYYPTTEIKKGASDVGDVKASYLIKGFKTMKDWKYVEKAAEFGKVDCSGAFSYWYKQGGSFMYHGSNTMWRKYSTQKGKIGEIDLVPGMAVYKHRDWKPSDAGNPYYNDSIGNFYHVGLYIGNSNVIEAKSKKSNIVQSKISEWTHASRLKNTIYDIQADGENADSFSYPQVGVVSLNSGFLNARSGPGTNYPSVTKLYTGDNIFITGMKDGWYSFDYNSQKLYVKADYVKINKESKAWIITATVMNASDKDKIINFIQTLGYQPCASQAVD